MPEINMKNIVGDTFEDMTIAEMALVQGTGDVDIQTRSVIASTIAVSKTVIAATKASAVATANSSTPCGVASASVGATVGVGISAKTC